MDAHTGVGAPAPDIDLREVPGRDVDVRLWFIGADCRQRDYLLGNPHTYPGDVLTYCPHAHRTLTLTASRIHGVSPEAELWLLGYLAGCERRAVHRQHPPRGSRAVPARG